MRWEARDQAQGKLPGAARTPRLRSLHMLTEPLNIPISRRGQREKGAYPLASTERGSHSFPDRLDSSFLWAAILRSARSPLTSSRVPGPGPYLKASAPEGGGFIPP